MRTTKRKPPRNPQPRHLQCVNWKMISVLRGRISWCMKQEIEVDAGGVARECFEKRKEGR